MHFMININPNYLPSDDPNWNLPISAKATPPQPPAPQKKKKTLKKSQKLKNQEPN